MAGRSIDSSSVDAVWLQHEFGIFGGEAGDWIVDLLTPVAAPLIVSFHTILSEPTPAQRRVMDWLIARATQLVVMSNEGAAALRRVYRVRAEQIRVIAHGVPDRPFGRGVQMKSKFDLVGHDVLMTFGLLSPKKGLETVIAALPAIVATNPKVIYVIAGATHEKVLAFEGEAYRERLMALAHSLGVADHIRWVDRYLPTAELLDLIEAADIYVTPYLNAEQSTSGTLSYAVALGKAVISTPYRHAVELLENGVGVVVPFGDPPATAKAVCDLLGCRADLAAMQQRAYGL
ncbi:MAG: glycosyltransferase [Sphingopyxis sp.]|nr:glycosyltransferase [Sphingopyxis sp.]